MIEWYSEKEISIFFDKEPDTCLRMPEYAKNKVELQSIKKYPFRNKQPLQVVIFVHKIKKKYSFIIPIMNWDGASIPKVFWMIIGSNTNPFYRIPSLIHDYLCLNKKSINYDRKLSTKIFEVLLKRAKVEDYKIQTMCFLVDNFQKFRGWKKPKTKIAII